MLLWSGWRKSYEEPFGIIDLIYKYYGGLFLFFFPRKKKEKPIGSVFPLIQALQKPPAII